MSCGPLSPPARPRHKRHDRALAVVALITLVAALWVGSARENAKIESYLRQALPAADRFEALADQTYAAYSGDDRLGYVAIGEADGYGGPMRVAVAVDDRANVLGVSVVESRETPSFLDRVMGSRFPKQLVGKSYVDAFTLGEDVDGVTGATYTSRALAAAVLEGTQLVATGPLGLTVPAAPAPPIQVGVPEIAVIALFAAGFIARRRRFKQTKRLRWAMLLTSLIVLGFLFNVPLTLSRVDSLLLGSWPQWQTNLYWYLLIGGILLFAAVENRNAYCGWFCPFGAAQECLGAVGGAKLTVDQRYRRPLLWLQRGLVWLAMLLALLFLNPGLTSYEVFSTLFSLTGSTVLFALLGIVLALSLFVKRPWCRYLCPMGPIYDLLQLARTWVVESWRRARQRVGTPSR